MDSKWPELNYETWKDTLTTLHMWTQIVGKLKLSHMPWTNHSWHSTLFVTSRGLTTSGVYNGKGKFQADFDFVEHTLGIKTSDGGEERFSLASETVAEFWSHVQHSCKRLGIETHFDPRPNEVVESIPFAKDEVHRTYDKKSVEQFWTILLRVDNLLQKFRSGFVGKSSPAHFFWGSFDLAVTRFSGRRAPEHPGGVPHLPDIIAKEAYSHEVSSCGFWPGNEMYPRAAFYSYAYPEPGGFKEVDLGVSGTSYNLTLKEFILPYDEAIKSDSPEDIILKFFQRSYEAAANLGHWNRSDLEESPYLQELQRLHRVD